ncbi:spore gernimation protein GerPD [Brevibacillus ruminantium]|uniref:Spore gernimation protein GerPD n=1 Tax=Brevibacillus ruminantium TaxID=2950604 RepID=A0ABY4WGM4_9BACL|nr:spore gernimation protein GerPD [Brevibacillus ruminantium]USG66183.1 spore gernimation protein GerPD [Brevibacillus ruminantium]
MNYKMINGDVSVKSIQITNLAGASTVFVGDTNCVSLSMFFEGPPEELIVGVSLGVAPPVRLIPLV